jgi:hypothetical protein
LYYTINQGLNLASILNDSASITEWSPKADAIKVAANSLLWNPATNLFIDNETTTLSPQDGNAWAVKANLTLSMAQSSSITNALKSRWGKYGAPAPEAGSPLTISPFIGSFELEAHFIGAETQDALDLIRLQWGFMLNDPRMTNSTFIEGYSADGSLHYAPYNNDPRVSHAHGWSTGPTSLMSFYIAGIHLTSSIGKTWKISPALGDLTDVDAGFATPLGMFSSTVSARDGAIQSMKFKTPIGTKGIVSLPGVKGELIGGPRGDIVKLIDGEVADLPGGEWTLKFS